jgi:hypothetical protein
MKLTAFEVEWAGVIARAIIPDGTLGIDTAGLGPALAEEIERAPWWSHLVIRLGLWLVWLAPLRAFPPRTFGGLDEEARARAFERLAGARSYAVREAVMLVKLNTCLVALGDEAVLARVGAYDLGERRRPGALPMVSPTSTEAGAVADGRAP